VAGLLVSVLFASTPTPVSARENTTALEGQVRALQKYLEREQDKKSSTPLSSSELRTSIEAGVEWLKNAQEPNGHFKYEYIPYENRYREDDNIVRQTGALYVLGEIIKRNKSDSFKISGTLTTSLSYFSSLTKITDGNGRCIAMSSVSTKCQLGATSLALIGLLGYLDYAPSKKSLYAKDVDGYLAFILEMQKENGGFRNQYRVRSTKQSSTESPFSNGEALLALVRYYEFNKRADVKGAIDRAFTHLKEQPYDAALYLWIMAALKDLNQIDPNSQYVEYAEAFTKWRVAGGASYLTGTRNTCPYAEGIASALSILKSTIPESRYQSYRAVLDKGNQMNYQFQISNVDTTRVLMTPSGITLKALSFPPPALGGFLTSNSEPTQRIDFTQHCINSYLQTLVDLDGQKLTL
jgi:hypothetical protein